MKKIIFASKNKGKIKEIKALLEPLGYKIVSLYDLGYDKPIIETGNTFFENSLIKAKTISDYYGEVVIADDSGLEVESLNNEPGVNSAYYASLNATDEQNNELLIKKLKNKDNKKAKFVCVICLYFPNNQHFFFQGKVEGLIIEQPMGSDGFGYDPHFYLKEYDKTMAQISIEQKNKVSHRGNALAKLVVFLKDYQYES